MSWLDEVLLQTKDYESPRQFWYWSALSTLSAIVKDKIWVEREGDLPVFLNIYVLLFARSGFRKGPPINLAKQLVQRVNNTRVISGRSSVEAIIEELKEVQTDPKTKTIITDSCGFILASEFSSAIVRSEQALNILTDLYDRKYNEGEFAIRLIRTGKNILKNPIITLLGGINEAHFESFMEDKDITGGFIGRTFIIHADSRNKINSLMYKMEHTINYDKLADHLKLVRQLQGPLIIEDTGKKIYDSWYSQFYTGAGPDDKTGTYERVGDSALKIAGLLSVARGTDMIVTSKDIIAGIQHAEGFVHSAKHVTFTIHEEESISTMKKRVLKILVKRSDHKITRQRLLSDLHGVMNADDLNKVCETLEQAGLIKVTMYGDNVVMEMTKSALEKFQHVFEGE